jgi:hypothetical protein
MLIEAIPFGVAFFVDSIKPLYLLSMNINKIYSWFGFYFFYFRMKPGFFC